MTIETSRKIVILGFGFQVNFLLKFWFYPITARQGSHEWLISINVDIFVGHFNPRFSIVCVALFLIHNPHNTLFVTAPLPIVFCSIPSLIDQIAVISLVKSLLFPAVIT